MNLADFDIVAKANAGTTLKLTSPFDGEVIIDERNKDKHQPWTITILGSDSDLFRKAQMRNQEKVLDGYARNKKKKTDLTEARIKGAELVARCTTGCHLVDEKNNDVKFSIDGMVKLYMKYPWMLEQVENHMSDRSVLMTS